MTSNKREALASHSEGLIAFRRGSPHVRPDLLTKDDITMREAVFPDRVTPPSTTEAYKKAPRSGVAKMSEYIMDGVWDGFTPPPLPEAR